MQKLGDDKNKHISLNSSGLSLRLNYTALVYTDLFKLACEETSELL